MLLIRAGLREKTPWANLYFGSPHPQVSGTSEVESKVGGLEQVLPYLHMLFLAPPEKQLEAGSWLGKARHCFSCLGWGRAG